MLTFNKRGLYMLKIAICDDEQIFIDILKSQLNGIFSQLNADVCIYPFSGAGALINYMDSTYFDVIFLDIDMPEITGFDAAKKVKEISPESKIIFVTSKHDLVYNSFEYQPFYFIRKREKSEMSPELTRVAEKLMVHFRQNHSITINDKLRLNKELLIKDIIYVKSEKHYLLYYTAKDEIHPPCERASLLLREKELLSCDFIKPHQRFLINMNHIKNLDVTDALITMSNGEAIPLSKNYRQEAIEKYRLFKRR